MVVSRQTDNALAIDDDFPITTISRLSAFGLCYVGRKNETFNISTNEQGIFAGFRQD
jgi:hypothetical protein